MEEPQEPHDEEGIARRLAQQERRQGLNLPGLTVKGVAAQQPERVEAQRGHLEGTEGRARGVHRSERPGQAMVRPHLLGTVGAEEQHVAEVRCRGQALEQLERARIRPLHVIHEEDEGRFPGGEDLEEGLDGELEAALCLHGSRRARREAALRGDVPARE